MKKITEDILINPWVWVVKFKVLSTTGKPDEWLEAQIETFKSCK